MKERHTMFPAAAARLTRCRSSYSGTCRLLSAACQRVVNLSLLEKPEDISGGIAESRSDFRRIHANRLNDLAAVSNYCFDCRRNVIHHDVDHQSNFGHRLPAKHPGAAYLAYTVIESGRAVARFARSPAKSFSVKSGRYFDIRGGNLEVTDLSVPQGWRRHVVSASCGVFYGVSFVGHRGFRLGSSQMQVPLQDVEDVHGKL